MTAPIPTRPQRRRMSGRDPHEAHRVSTPLELLFDLTFVVAIAAAAAQLHHAVAAQHLGQGLFGFVAVFFAIWWAWMHYTWFASAYDTDDASFRLLTMVQMAGVLLLAAGVPQGADSGNLTIITFGYVVMRLGLVLMWWRVAQDHPDGRATALRYIRGILAVQVLWLLRLLLPQDLGLVAWAALILAELWIPMWAARKGYTPWHAHHVAERHGLFTIIVLGEGVLGSSNAVASALKANGWSLEVALVGLGSTSLILALWWIYFLVPSGEVLHQHRRKAFAWSYVHVLVYGALAALGAFIGVLADQLGTSAAAAATGGAGAHGALSPVRVIGLVAAAVAIYLVAVGWMAAMLVQGRGRLAGHSAAALGVLVAVVAAVAAGLPLAWALPLVTLAPLVVIVRVEASRRQAPVATR